MRERPTIVMSRQRRRSLPDQGVLRAFSEFAQVVHYDHRGHGRSDDGEQDRWNLVQWADDLVALCAALGIERPVVFGFSFGGAIAPELRRFENPTIPRRIVVVCARHINPEASIRMYVRLGGPDVPAA